MAVGAQTPHGRPVYIVEMQPGGESSNVHIQPGVNPTVPNQSYAPYQATTRDEQFAFATGTPARTEKPPLEEKNPVEMRYDQLMNGRIGRWLSAAIALGLAAGVISKRPGTLLQTACIINMVIAGIHLFPLGPAAKPIAPNNVRPPTWYLIVLSISTLSWIAAMSLMFAVISEDDKYVIFDPKKHATRGVGTLIGTGTGTLAMLENITIACGCMGASAFICCLYQWYIVRRIFTDKFEEADIRKAFSG